MKRGVWLAVVCAVLAAPAFAADGVAESLSRKVSTFQANGPLDKAVAALATAGKVKIAVDWDRLTAAGLDKQTRAVVRASDATVKQLLDLLVLSASEKDAPLGWYIDGDKIRVTTKAAIEDRRPARTASANTPARTSGASAQPAKEAAPAAVPIAKALEGGVEFSQTPLREVVNFLRDKARLNIAVNWTALEEVGITKDSPVSLKARNLTLGRVLDLLLADVSGSRDKYERLYYVIDDGVVLISTGNALNTKTSTTVTDVSDLLHPVPNPIAPVLKLNITTNRDNKNNDNGSPFEESRNEDKNDPRCVSREEYRRLVGERLVQAIKDSIGEDMWQPEGKGAIQITARGQLIITQTPLGFKLLGSAGR
ncbi:MAG: hypothetical protein FWE88_01015 [Phycisphaerae bacterium]|nr:hypothetical protein [Phycisphaerae bacterium]